LGKAYTYLRAWGREAMPPVLVREYGVWKVLKPSETDPRFYYYNTKTKEVTWLVPPGLPEAGPQSPKAASATPDREPVYRARRNSLSSSAKGPNLFGVALEIDNLMVNSSCEPEDSEFEVSRSENDRGQFMPPQPAAPPAPAAPEPAEPEVAWKPVVGQPCGALWTDGNYWKAVVLEDFGGLRYKVVYDVDGTEALVVREALRPTKATLKPAPQRPVARSPPPTMGRAGPANSEQARVAALVQQFTAEFPTLRLPSLEDFYRPQYAAALQRFGHHDFELLCDFTAKKGGSFFKSIRH